MIILTIYILIAFCTWVLAAQKMSEDFLYGEPEPFDYLALTFFSLCFAAFWPVMLTLFVLSIPVKYLLTRKK